MSELLLETTEPSIGPELSGIVRLNVGSGRNMIESYINIDVQATGDIKPDILADGRSIPLPDMCADEVLAVHLFEHFYRWECDDVIAEWRRLLKIGGRLVLELPNLAKCCQNVIDEIEGRKDPEQLGMWGLYGDPRTKDPYMVHKWGWTPKALRAFLEGRGFNHVREKPTQFHSIGRFTRDMRIEARRI